MPNTPFGSKTKQEAKYGFRRDGTPKGAGFFGELPLPNGGVATEFSVGVNLDGKEVDIPLLVPTLSKEELNRLTNSIIPNKEQIPQDLITKAVEHAVGRMKKGKSPFYASKENTNMPQSNGNMDELLGLALTPPGTNPLTEENLPGATSVTVKFDPDGTYKQNVTGRFAPVKQLAQTLAQSPRKPQNFGALGPEQILAASKQFQQTGANRQNALSNVATLAAQLQGADINTRKQLLEEHKTNNPDLVMTPEGVALHREDIPKYLADKRNNLSADKQAVFDRILDHYKIKTVDQPEARAYVGSQGAAAGASNALRDRRLAERQGQTLDNEAWFKDAQGRRMHPKYERAGRGGASTKNLDYDAFNEQFGFLTKTKQGKKVVPRTDLTDNEVRVFNKAWAPFGAGAKRVIVPEADEGKNVPLVYPTVADMPPLDQAVELGKQLVGIEATYPSIAEVFKREGFDDDTIIATLLRLGINPREFAAALPGSKETRKERPLTLKEANKDYLEKRDTLNTSGRYR